MLSYLSLTELRKFELLDFNIGDGFGIVAKLSLQLKVMSCFVGLIFHINLVMNIYERVME